MPVQHISLGTIKALKQGETIWDDAVIGFGVRRQRRAAVYVFKYRDRNGRQRFITIGRHGAPWSPEGARDEAKQYQLMLVSRRGAADRRGGVVDLTLQEFSKLYVERYATLHKKPRSVAEDRRNLEAHILPKLGAKALSNISPQDVAGFMASRKECPANANRCLALLSHIFTIGAEWGAVSAGSNPCRGARRFREQPRERYLSQEELARLGRALAEADSSLHAGAAATYEEDWRAVGSLQLVLYTGARLTEVLSLQWQQISWEGGFADRSKPTSRKIMPLPKPALDLLHRISQRHGSQGKYVFPGKRNGSHFTGIQKPWQRIRSRVGLQDVRIEDLRRCHTSIAKANAIESMVQSANRAAAHLSVYLHGRP